MGHYSSAKMTLITSNIISRYSQRVTTWYSAHFVTKEGLKLFWKEFSEKIQWICKLLQGNPHQNNMLIRMSLMDNIPPK